MDDDEDFCLGGIELPIGATSSESFISEVDEEKDDVFTRQPHGHRSDGDDTPSNKVAEVSAGVYYLVNGNHSQGTTSYNLPAGHNPNANYNHNGSYSGTNCDYTAADVVGENDSPQNRTESVSSCRGSQRSSPKSTCLPIDLDASEDALPFDVMLGQDSDYEKVYRVLRTTIAPHH